MNVRWRARPPVPILLFSCLPLILGVYAAWDLYVSQSRSSEVVAVDVVSMRAAEELAIAFRDIRTHLDHFLYEDDAETLRRIREMRPDMDHWLAEAQRTAVAPREKDLTAQVTAGYDAFFADLDRLERRPPADRAAAVQALAARSESILQPAQDYLDFNEAQIQQGSADNQLTTARLVVGLLLLGVCGPVTGLLAGYGVSRAVSRSVVRLSVPVLDAAGKLNGVVGPVAVSGGRSVDELEAVLRRMAEQIGTVVERLQQSQAEALRAEQLAAVGQMAAGFAHELRNPLMAMKILVQAAAERGGVGLVGRDLAVMEEEMTRLERLTSTLLDFARPPRPEKRLFDVGALVEGCVDLVSSQAAQRDVRIDCDLPEEPLWAEADAGQVRQVVLNLLLNALEAVQDSGAVRVRLAEERGRGGRPAPGRGGGWLALRVEDTGPGLPPDLGQDIFAPFVSTKPTGIGLGLSICKRIAEAHGGTVAAENRPGRGAAFSVRLPCRRDPAAQPAATA